MYSLLLLCMFYLFFKWDPYSFLLNLSMVCSISFHLFDFCMIALAFLVTEKNRCLYQPLVLIPITMIYVFRIMSYGRIEYNVGLVGLILVQY